MTLPNFMIIHLTDIPIYLRTLLQHRLRTFLSTIGVLFGTAALIAMLSIGEGAKQETLKQIALLGIDSLIIRQPKRTDEQRAIALEKKSKGLTLKDLIILEQNIPDLLAVSPVKVIQAPLSGSLTEISPEILAINRSYGEIKRLNLLEGRFIAELDLEKKHLVCVIGYEVAKELGKQGHTGGILTIGRVPFEIIGVLKSLEWKEAANKSITTQNIDKSIFIPFGTEKSFFTNESSSNEDLTEILLQLKNPSKIYNVAQLAESILIRQHGGYDDYQIIIPIALLEQADRSQKMFNMVLGGLAALSLLVGGIGIMNIMLATVYERMKEIGIRRALGATPQHICIQFLIETLIITIVGASFGIILGIGISHVISLVAGWKTIVSVWSILLSIVMSCLVGIGSGLYPALQAARMDPIQALRK